MPFGNEKPKRAPGVKNDENRRRACKRPMDICEMPTIYTVIGCQFIGSPFIVCPFVSEVSPREGGRDDPGTLDAVPAARSSWSIARYWRGREIDDAFRE